MVGVYASTCLEWIKLLLFIVRSSLQSASPCCLCEKPCFPRRGLGPCLPARHRVDGNQRDFEGKRHSIVFSCACPKLKAPMTPWSFTHIHSSILVPRRLLVACSALAAPEVSAILAVTVLQHLLISIAPNSQRSPLRHSEG